jgi:hypothetical protein
MTKGRVKLTEEDLPHQSDYGFDEGLTLEQFNWWAQYSKSRVAKAVREVK